jgi:hypothetical protein
MKRCRLLALPLVALVAWAIPCAPACADSVLYNDAVLVQGQQGFVEAFDLTKAGTLSMSVSNIPWLDTVSNLSFFLTTSAGTLGSLMGGAGTESVQVGPGMVYAHWFGDAAGAYGLGVVGVNIQFLPQGTTAVGLPGSLLLMLSGLILLYGWRRHGAQTMPGARIEAA